MTDDPLTELGAAHRNLMQARNAADAAASKLAEAQVPVSHADAQDLKVDIEDDIQTAQNLLDHARRRLGIKSQGDGND